MNEILDSHYQRLIADQFRFVTSRIHEAIDRPSVLFRPKIYPDGNMWCALYGEDIQCGVAGFGDSPAIAMADFDNNWVKRISDTTEAADDRG